MARARRSPAGVNAERERNRARQSTRRQSLKKTDPARHLFERARKNARAHGLPFNLEVSDCAMPEHCPVLGYRLIFGRNTRKYNYPTVDRLVPQLGYVKGNVAVISWRANWLKGDGYVDEFENLVRWMRAGLRSGVWPHTAGSDRP